MINIAAQEAGFKAFLLVRDKDGNPKVDSPNTLPAEVFKAFTDEDVKYVYGDGELPEHLKTVKRI